MPNPIKAKLKAVTPVGMWGLLRAAKQSLQKSFFEKRVVRHQYAGRELALFIEDPVAELWYDMDWELPAELEAVTKAGLKDNPLVFDLGAHQCVVAMMVAHAFGPASKIIAVEGSRYNVEIARRNIEANGFENIEVLNALVSSRDGVGNFTNAWCGTVASDGQSLGTESVPALCIDTLQQRFGAPQLVYMDIEGFEFEALKGAEQALSTGAIWVVEAHGDEQLGQYGASNGHVVKLFLDRGFETWFALEGSATFSRLDRDAVVPGVRCYLLAVPEAAASLKQVLRRQSEP